MIHSLKKFHPYVRVSFNLLINTNINLINDFSFFFCVFQFVATACLFFACKVEEQPRRLKEFIDHVQLLLHNKTIEHGSEVNE